MVFYSRTKFLMFLATPVAVHPSLIWIYPLALVICQFLRRTQTIALIEGYRLSTKRICSPSPSPSPFYANEYEINTDAFNYTCVCECTSIPEKEWHFETINGDIIFLETIALDLELISSRVGHTCIVFSRSCKSHLY